MGERLTLRDLRPGERFRLWRDCNGLSDWIFEASETVNGARRFVFVVRPGTSQGTECLFPLSRRVVRL